ncbi:hypothetical protein J3Q64DRAFT_1713398 [Phycomyces blakesleeanus]|uniref:Uncharacterized protein n=1 Tax=Phycomyces blakesleeanus TaxID=4837 RepID=A0ABR3BEZ6_PHYBL
MCILILPGYYYFLHHSLLLSLLLVLYYYILFTFANPPLIPPYIPFIFFVNIHVFRKRTVTTLSIYFFSFFFQKKIQIKQFSF